jgi:hypothetical protein
VIDDAIDRSDLLALVLRLGVLEAVEHVLLVDRLLVTTWHDLVRLGGKPNREGGTRTRASAASRKHDRTEGGTGDNTKEIGGKGRATGGRTGKEGEDKARIQDGERIVYVLDTGVSHGLIGGGSVS